MLQFIPAQCALTSRSKCLSPHVQEQTTMGLKPGEQKFTRRQHPLILSTDEMKSTDIYILSSNVFGMKCAICSNIVPSCIDGHKFLSVFFHYPSEKQQQLSFPMCIYCYIISKADRERIRPVFECVLQEVHHQEPLQLYGVTASDTKNFNQLASQNYIVVIWFFL